VLVADNGRFLRPTIGSERLFLSLERRLRFGGRAALEQTERVEWRGEAASDKRLLG
jgi:hypothetical protein